MNLVYIFIEFSISFTKFILTLKVEVHPRAPLPSSRSSRGQVVHTASRWGLIPGVTLRNHPQRQLFPLPVQAYAMRGLRARAE